MNHLSVGGAYKFSAGVHSYTWFC